jgi:hypothetical protein
MQFYNGKLAGEKIISQFTSLSGGEETKLIDMHTTFILCENYTSFLPKFIKKVQYNIVFIENMNDDDKVRALFFCGKNNSPNTVTGLMDNLENSLTVK